MECVLPVISTNNMIAGALAKYSCEVNYSKKPGLPLFEDTVPSPVFAAPSGSVTSNKVILLFIKHFMAKLRTFFARECENATRIKLGG